ncbi:hypothetical protein RJ640_003121 [Escallonia rubra]|uniref:RPW8 domain-containing protein n=1 Tax=Escallonia rubra TaxID=112253 RepID=A0AA88QX75_9ASTE|nr:hypothetical protein RJ640_003121 [Escallonia rubra]
MAADLNMTAALVAPFHQLLTLVSGEAETALKFKSILTRLKGTLLSLQPYVDRIDQLDLALNRPITETSALVNRLKHGHDLVRKCSKIASWNIIKQYIYSHRLLDFEEWLLRFFQVDVQVQLARDTRKVLVEVNDLEEEVNRLLAVPGRSSSSLSDRCDVPDLPDLVVGLDLPLTEVKGMVTMDGGSSVAVVVVSAPGGCGKTTLAKMVCRDAEIRGIYRDNIFFVVITKTANLQVIVQKIFRHKGYHKMSEFQSDEDALNQLEQLLRKIGAGAPILLVLDDVWSGGESLIGKFMFQIQGYKILVTSRFVFPRFHSTYKLNLLNDQDAITLFRHSVCPRYDISSLPHDLVNKIVEGCKGFPLALTVVGRALCDQHEVILEKWSEGRSIFDSNSDLLACLQASLDALDDRAIVAAYQRKDMAIVKECFLDLGSFPENQRIPATVLMDMWVELYDLDEEGMYTLANLLELSARNLVNLVPDRNDPSKANGYCEGHFVTQHGMLRELAIYKSSQGPIEKRKRLIMDLSGIELPKWWVEQVQQPTNARIISISTDEMFPSNWSDIHVPAVEVLILNFWSRSYTLPHFMLMMDQLKVLILTSHVSSAAKVNNLTLLGNISSLRRIRMEHVSLSFLSTCSSQMENLQKLSLIMCEIDKFFENYTDMFPNLVEMEIEYCEDLVALPIGLCDTVHLKKLSITYCYKLGALPGGFGRLTNLEVLRLNSCTTLLELPESIGSLQRLSFLDISHCLKLGRLPERMGELRGLRTLHMGGCWGLDELPPSVKDLCQLETVMCDEDTDILWRPYENHLSNLKKNVVKEDIAQNWLHHLPP